MLVIVLMLTSLNRFSCAYHQKNFDFHNTLWISLFFPLNRDLDFPNSLNQDSFCNNSYQSQIVLE